MPVKVATDKVEFELENGQTFAVPLVTTSERLVAIVADLDASGNNHSLNHLKALQGWIGEKHEGILITLDEADAIWRHIEAEFSKKNERHRNALRQPGLPGATTQPSPGTTDSMPLPGAKNGG